MSNILGVISFIRSTSPFPITKGEVINSKTEYQKQMIENEINKFFSCHWFLNSYQREIEEDGNYYIDYVYILSFQMTEVDKDEALKNIDNFIKSIGCVEDFSISIQ